MHHSRQCPQTHYLRIIIYSDPLNTRARIQHSYPDLNTNASIWTRICAPSSTTLMLCLTLMTCALVALPLHLCHDFITHAPVFIHTSSTNGIYTYSWDVNHQLNVYKRLFWQGRDIWDDFVTIDVFIAQNWLAPELSNAHVEVIEHNPAMYLMMWWLDLLDFRGNILQCA